MLKIQRHFVFGILAGTEHPAAGLPIDLLAIALQNPKNRFVSVDNIFFKKQRHHALTQRFYPVGVSDYPVRHGRPAKLNALRFPVLFLPVKRCSDLVFLLDHICDSSRTCHAFLNYRNGHIRLYNSYVIRVFFLAGLAFVFLPVIIQNLNLRRDNIQLAADEFFTYADQFLTAFRALFIFKVDYDFFVFNAVGKFLAGKSFSPRVGLNVDRFNGRLISLGRGLLLSFIEQRKLL